MSDSRLALVTGATGQQGGSVARRLLEGGFRVRGITRNLESGPASQLMGLGAEMVRAEFTDAGSLAAALGGVNAVFAMTTPFEAGVDAETAQGVALVDAAADAGVDHFVYSSVASANKATGVPHFESKYRVEEHLAASDLRWSVIAPVYFMDNLFFPDMLNGLKDGTYAHRAPDGSPATADRYRGHRRVCRACSGQSGGVRREEDRHSGRRALFATVGRRVGRHPWQADFRGRGADRWDSVLQRRPRPHVRVVRQHRIRGKHRRTSLVPS